MDNTYINEDSQVANPMQTDNVIGKYNVTAKLVINGEEQSANLTLSNKIDFEKNNIYIVFDSERYAGSIPCSNITSVTGKFVVNDKTYMLEENLDFVGDPLIDNFVQIKCGDKLRTFKLVDVRQLATSSVSNTFAQAIANVNQKKGGKHSRKAGKKASYKVGGRRAKRHSIRRRGTRKK
jgi:hypothetical protein